MRNIDIILAYLSLARLTNVEQTLSIDIDIHDNDFQALQSDIRCDGLSFDSYYIDGTSHRRGQISNENFLISFYLTY